MYAIQFLYVSLENLVLDQLRISQLMIFFILVSCLIEIVFVFIKLSSLLFYPSDHEVLTWEINSIRNS